MLAGMIFQREPFFRGTDNYDQMVKIARILGLQDVISYVDKFNLKMHPNIETKMQNFTKKPWERFVNT